MTFVFLIAQTLLIASFIKQKIPVVLNNRDLIFKDVAFKILFKRYAAFAHSVAISIKDNRVCAFLERKRRVNPVNSITAAIITEINSGFVGKLQVLAIGIERSRV
jgi:hypothetical protein